MPRRQPPTSLRLVEGPLPMRGQARHTLPSVPRPVLVSINVSRSLNWSSSARSEPRAAALTPPGLSHAGRGVGAGSVYSYAHSYSASCSEVSLTQPLRRPVERGLDTSGLGLGSGLGMGTGSGHTSPVLSPLSAPSSQPPVRGPWDHSRVVSLPIDVGSVLPLPKPVAISP